MKRKKTLSPDQKKQVQTISQFAISIYMGWRNDLTLLDNAVIPPRMKNRLLSMLIDRCNAALIETRPSMKKAA